MNDQRGPLPLPECSTVARTKRESKQHEKSVAVGSVSQPGTREGQAGPRRMAERPVVALKPGNAGGAKGPWFQTRRQKERRSEIGDEPATS
jgi:hypothetical protein